MLNTNEAFDYGDFRDLAATASSSTSISSFGFTFREAGVYVFTMSSDPSSYMIMAVMDSDVACSTEDGAPFVPMTAKNMKAVNAKLSSSIVVEPDWAIIGGLLGGLTLLIFGVVACLYWFRRRAWAMKQYRAPHYRSKGLNSDQLQLQGTTGSAVKKKKPSFLPGSSAPIAPGDSGDVEAAAAVSEADMSNALPPFTPADGDSDWARKDQLQRHHDVVEQEFSGQVSPNKILI